MRLLRRATLVVPLLLLSSVSVITWLVEHERQTRLVTRYTCHCNSFLIREQRFRHWGSYSFERSDSATEIPSVLYTDFLRGRHSHSWRMHWQTLIDDSGRESDIVRHDFIDESFYDRFGSSWEFSPDFRAYMRSKMSADEVTPSEIVRMASYPKRGSLDATRAEYFVHAWQCSRGTCN